MPMAIERVGVNGMDELRFVSNLVQPSDPEVGREKCPPLLARSNVPNVSNLFCILCTNESSA